jgi:putative transposase
MPQSFAQLYTHLIFSTKNRLQMIHEEIRDDLQAYFGGTLSELGCPSFAIKCVADHVHLLYLHSKKLAPIKVVEEVKIATSKWVKTKGGLYRRFYWQRGYGMFSFSATRRDAVIRYIQNQEKHHRKKSYQDEMRGGGSRISD